MQTFCWRRAWGRRKSSGFWKHQAALDFGVGVAGSTTGATDTVLLSG